MIPGETNVNVVVEKNGKPVGSKEGIDIINKNKNNITEGGKLYLLSLVLHISKLNFSRNANKNVLGISKN